jgi:hypothetical protein
MHFYLIYLLVHHFTDTSNKIPQQTISRAEKVGEDYTAEEVMVDVKVEASQVEGLRQQLQDATKGAGRLEGMSI